MPDDLIDPRHPGPDYSSGECGPHVKRRIPFTPEVREKFLDAFARTGLKIESAAAANISPFAVTQALRRDPEFQEQYDLALAKFRESLQTAAHERGVKGVIKDLIKRDGVFIEIRSYSDRLLEMLLKRHIPEFREHVRVDQVNVNAEADIETLMRKLPPEKRAQFRELLSELSASTPGGAPDVHDAGRPADASVQPVVLDQADNPRPSPDDRP